MMSVDFGGIVQPWHVLTAVIMSVAGVATALKNAARSANEFKNNVLDELKVTRVSIKELLVDLAARNPEAMGRVAASMDDETVAAFVRESRKRNFQPDKGNKAG